MKIKYKSFWRNLEAMGYAGHVVRHFGYNYHDKGVKLKVFNILCRISSKEYSHLINRLRAKQLLQYDRCGLMERGAYESAKAFAEGDYDRL